MKFKINILPSGVTFKSENILLDDALMQSIPLEHSCKTGDCGICSAEIVDGLVVNEEGVTINSGTVLTCSSKAASDVTLKVSYYPKLAGIKVRTLPCKVDSFCYPVEDVVIIKLRFPPKSCFDFVPGQYIDLTFKNVKRSYSIANAKSGYAGIELHVKNIPSGKMSENLFTNLKNNQLMSVEGPKGTFFLRESQKKLIFLAGGTGIAPVKSIVQTLISNNEGREIFIYWGISSLSALYTDVLEKWSNSFQNISYVPVVSGDKLNWSGRTGFVHQAVCEDFQSLKDFQVYACGSSLMINAAHQAFTKKGLPEEQFFSDAFVPAR